MTLTMLIVSNTSPILNLAIIDRLPLLKKQFRKFLFQWRFLMKAYFQKDISSVGLAIADLQNKAGFRLAEEVIQAVLKETP